MDYFIEKEIKGVETEIALLETENGIVTGKIGQIEYEGDFYDYERKYTDATTKLVIPAKISEKCEKIIKEYARRLFIGALCRGFCRIDFFVTESEEVIFNEINAIPGFTSGSMFPLLMQDRERGIQGVIDDILAELGSVAEGVKTSKALCELAKKLGIDVPVSNAIYEAVYTDITPQEVLSKLMNRKLKKEECYDKVRS